MQSKFSANGQNLSVPEIEYSTSDALKQLFINSDMDQVMSTNTRYGQHKDSNKNQTRDDKKGEKNKHARGK